MKTCKCKMCTPPITITQLLDALDKYNKKRRTTAGYHKLLLYPDGSGMILDPYGVSEPRNNFDTIAMCLDTLRG